MKLLFHVHKKGVNYMKEYEVKVSISSKDEDIDELYIQNLFERFLRRTENVHLNFVSCYKVE